MYGKLSGYKTFIVAGLAIAAAALGFLDGDLTRAQAAPIIVNALLGMTLRSGLNTVLGQALERALISVALAAPPLRRVPVPVQTVAPKPAPVPVPEPEPEPSPLPAAVEALSAVERLISDFRAKQPG